MLAPLRWVEKRYSSQESSPEDRNFKEFLSVTKGGQHVAD
jgi:hypothetical protein